MAGHVDSALPAGEYVTYRATVSVWSLVPYLFLGFLLVFHGLGVLFFAIAAIKYFSTELAITNRRVIAKFGLISRKTTEINLKKIQNIQIEQSVLGRMFNFGAIVVSGAENPRAKIPGISFPLQFRDELVETQASVEPVCVAT
ncbi:MAG: PH domain-containing protein [Nevskiaceae bacterium]|jgi:uncharacterized membrane protein YdbT with pleckstrin-like domain|nr:PH domain-containing protein [Nevskiaceae bacterium]